MEQTDQSTSAEALKKTSTVHFFLRLEARRLPLFFQLLGAGFEMIVPTDCSVKELLCQHLKIEEDYLENRIQTIIMNGKAFGPFRSYARSRWRHLAQRGRFGTHAPPNFTQPG
jgi:hypothetical protein